MRTALLCALLLCACSASAAQCDVSLIGIQGSEAALQVDCGSVGSIDFYRNDHLQFGNVTVPASGNFYFVSYLAPGINEFSACADGCAVPHGKDVIVSIPLPFPPKLVDLTPILMLLLSD